MSYEDKFQAGVNAVLDCDIEWINQSGEAKTAFLYGAFLFSNTVFPDQANPLDGALNRQILNQLLGRFETDPDPFSSSDVGKLYSELQLQSEAYADDHRSAMDDPERLSEAAFPRVLLARAREALGSQWTELRNAHDVCARHLGWVENCVEKVENGSLSDPEFIFKIVHRVRDMEEPLRFLFNAEKPK